MGNRVANSTTAKVAHGLKRRPQPPHFLPFTFHFSLAVQGVRPTRFTSPRIAGRRVRIEFEQPVILQLRIELRRLSKRG